MKKILLLLTLTLFLGLNNSATAQISEKITGPLWILQNPELAVEFTTMSFFSNQEGLLETYNLLTEKRTSFSFFWKENTQEKNTITINMNGSNFVYRIDVFSDGSIHLVNQYNTDDLNILAENGSLSDTYATKVERAVKLYGYDASMKNNGMPSSSRESGYSFLPRYSTCSICFGTGRCSMCNGTGLVTFNYQDYSTCSMCRGTGVCSLCQGSGIKKNY